MTATTLPQVGEKYLGEGSIKVAKLTVGPGAANDVVVNANPQTVALVNVPAGYFIHSVKTIVKTAFTASVTLTIGDGTSAAGFLASADIAPTSAVATGIPMDSELGGEAFAAGKLYEAADTIDIVVGGAVPAVGQLEVYVFYSDFSANI